MADYIYCTLTVRTLEPLTQLQSLAIDAVSEDFSERSDMDDTVELRGELRYGSLEDEHDDALREAGLEFDFWSDPAYEWGGSLLEVRNYPEGRSSRTREATADSFVVAGERHWNQAKDTGDPVAWMNAYFTRLPWADELPKGE